MGRTKLWRTCQNGSDPFHKGMKSFAQRETFLPACFCMGHCLCLEPTFLVATRCYILLYFVTSSLASPAPKTEAQNGWMCFAMDTSMFSPDQAFDWAALAVTLNFNSCKQMAECREQWDLGVSSVRKITFWQETSKIARLLRQSQFESRLNFYTEGVPPCKQCSFTQHTMAWTLPELHSRPLFFLVPVSSLINLLMKFTNIFEFLIINFV